MVITSNQLSMVCFIQRTKPPPTVRNLRWHVVHRYNNVHTANTRSLYGTNAAAGPYNSQWIPPNRLPCPTSSLGTRCLWVSAVPWTRPLCCSCPLYGRQSRPHTGVYWCRVSYEMLRAVRPLPIARPPFFATVAVLALDHNAVHRATRHIGPHPQN